MSGLTRKLRTQLKKKLDPITVKKSVTQAIQKKLQEWMNKSKVEFVIPLTTEEWIWAMNACWFREVRFEGGIHCIRWSVRLQFWIITSNSVTNVTLFYRRGILSRILRELFLYRNKRAWEQLNFRNIVKRMKIKLSNKKGEREHKWKLDFIVGDKF